MFFGVFQQIACLQVFDNAGTRVVAIQALIFTRCEIIDFGVEGQDADGEEFMPLPNLPVVKIVRWRYLHAAGTKSRVYIGVGDDGNGAFRQR